MPDAVSPSRSRSRDLQPPKGTDDEPSIGRLDFDANRVSTSSRGSSPRGLLRDDESLLSNVVDGIIERDRRKMKRQVMKFVSFGSAMISCLCAGSLVAFSVYGHLFISRLKYTQYEVNAVSIVAELAMYLPVPIFGYLCDRYNPRPLSLFSGIVFAIGYGVAAATYRAGPDGSRATMILAFLGVGMGTSCMYLSAVTACAKNFGGSKYKGLALSLPITAFGLSPLWQSQIGSKLLYERREDGSKGDIDVFQYFIFLGVALLLVGVLGSVLLVIVNEEELIEEAVEDLERSGLLAESPFFRRTTLHDADDHFHAQSNGYGTIRSEGDDDSYFPKPADEAAAEKARKAWLLNGETRRFLADHTMWLLAAGFFFVTGPIETFVNNLGTVLRTFYPPDVSVPPSNDAAVQVSALAISSTVARIIAGLLSDLLSPQTPQNPQYNSAANSLASLPPRSRFSISRVALLLFSTLLFISALIILLTPWPFDEPDVFILITALLGSTNGAAFSLVPIIISVVWGVQNFGTNWGVVAMMPAAGAAVWSAIYSAVYQGHTDPTRGEEGLCYGRDCWKWTVVGMLIAQVLALASWFWAWRGKGGWRSKGIVL